MSKKLTILAISVIVIISGAFLLKASKVSAEGEYPAIVQKIAERFGVNESDVKSVFDEHRNEMQLEMQQKFESRLNLAVSEGRITEGQKSAILAKHEELKNAHENWRDLTPEERSLEMQSMHESLKTWAEENGIDEEILRSLIGFGPWGRGFRHGFKAGYWFANNK